MKILILISFIIFTLETTCLHDMNLVKDNISTSEIIENHNNICDEDIKHFNGTVMGHISKYYSKGTELILLYAKKFDIISPIWYNIQRNNDIYTIEGNELYDQFLIEKLKTINPKIKIIPRYNLDFSTITYLDAQHEMFHGDFIETIYKHIEEYNFDGIELNTGVYLLTNRMSDYLTSMIHELGQSLHSTNKTLIITIHLRRTENNVLPITNIFTEFEIGRASCRERVSSPV